MREVAFSSQPKVLPYTVPGGAASITENPERDQGSSFTG